MTNTDSSPGTSAPVNQFVEDIPPPTQKDDLSQEPQDATPHRNPPRAQPARRTERPEVEDALTQLTQVLLEVRRDVNANQPPSPAETPEDPAFN